MRKYLITVICVLGLIQSISTSAKVQPSAFIDDVYETSIVFPAGFAVGNYVEFLKVATISAGASGYYEISISYTRDGIAAAATHIASISHANPAIWRETGRVNNNAYGGSLLNFSVDCNSEYENPRFRIRAVHTLGSIDRDITVFIKVRSINFNAAYTPLSLRGNDLTVNKFLPMTADWDLYVGNAYTSDGASLAIKAATNGNVGIGTATPTEKLSVNGNIRAREIKVETTNWPDYVFEESHKILPLDSVAAFIRTNKHLPEMPAAIELEKNGIAVSDMLKLQQKKIEELTLHLIEQGKLTKALQKQVQDQQKEIRNLSKTKK